MSSDRDKGPKLRLLRGAADESGDSAPLVDEEPLAAGELAELVESVRAAAGTSDIEAVDHEALLALSLGEELGTIDERERAEADALRMALEGEGAHALAELAVALRAASCERDLDPFGHERILRGALGSPAAARPSRGVWLGALAALAAGVALFLGTMVTGEIPGPVSQLPPSAARGAVAVQLFQTRSTQELFDPAMPFAKKGGESRRLDRIARARAADLRANRFASWGVR